MSGPWGRAQGRGEKGWPVFRFGQRNSTVDECPDCPSIVPRTLAPRVQTSQIHLITVNGGMARELSRQHFEDVENSCPMVALPSDVARSGISAKRAFETVFKAMVSVLERSLVQNGRRRRTTAQSIAALAIGGMVVARTMVDRALADELRAACTAVALNLGGWDKKRKSKKGKPKRPRPRRVAASSWH